MGEWRSQRIGDIAVWSRGGGPATLVVLHGGPGLSDYTQDLGDLLAEQLGDGWTVARFQQRGLAPSTTSGPFTVEQAVADVEDVCSALSSDPAVIVGHSWGGHLAMHAAVAAPARYRAVICVDALGAVPDGGMAALSNHLASGLTEEQAGARARIEERAATEGATGELGVADLAIVWPRYFADPTTAPPMPPMGMSVDAYVGLFGSLTEHFAAATLVQGLPKVSSPVLFVAGTQSPIPHAESERSAALIPSARVELAPVGHFPWLEDPGWAGTCITGFLDR